MHRTPGRAAALQAGRLEGSILREGREDDPVDNPVWVSFGENASTMPTGNYESPSPEPTFRNVPERHLPRSRSTGILAAGRTRRGAVVSRAVVLVLVGVLSLGACGGDEDDAAGTSAASATAPAGEPIVIRATLTVAAEEGSEPIATGTVLEGSTLGGTPFCAGGTILESHASLDPTLKAYLIDRKITCPDGTVRFGFTPEVGAGPAPEGQTPQKGVWTIVSGTGEFEGLSGSGKSEAVYGPNPSSPVRSTFTGTVTR
jgi:hypothetical protein